MGYNLLVQIIFVQLSQETSVSVWMFSTDYEGLSRYVGHNNERNTIMVIAKEGRPRFLEVTADRDDLLLWSIDYQVSKKHFERRLSERGYSEDNDGISEAAEEHV